MLYSFLSEVSDSRHRGGRRYQLCPILLAVLLSILSGADSYRKMAVFIRLHYDLLDKLFNLNWKQCPVHGTLCNIINSINAEELEREFRAYQSALQTAESGENSTGSIAVDGKVLRGSLDRLQDKKAVQVLSAFATDSHLILAHMDIEDKTNEIPKAQEMIRQLGLENHLFTFDAMHCQKKHLKPHTRVETMPSYR